MKVALRLARKGFTPPNPMVGCVIVHSGEIVGKGFCPMAGEPHAEVFALWQAGDRAKGATAYVTLEPHNYQGKTPPCTDALIKAGVARVVAATLDNNPRINGKGMIQLAEAGIETRVGVLESEAFQLNEAFFHFHATGTPFVTLKAAMTLDGKIATRTGDSKWITSEKARAYAHLLRAQSGAIMVGANTLLADDPALTSRLTPPSPRQPLRIVLDSRLRTPPDCQAVRLVDSKTPLLIVTSIHASTERANALEYAGAEVLRLPETPHGRVSLPALMQELGKREIISVLVDGGGELHASLLTERLAQKILFFVAPKIVGGRQAATPIGGEGVASMSEAIEATSLEARKIGSDVLLEASLPVKKLG